MTRLELNRLAPRGCLVRVKSDLTDHWFAVGVYALRMAEAVVCQLPEIASTDVVVARRTLKPAEIKQLSLKRLEALPCKVTKDGECVEPL